MKARAPTRIDRRAAGALVTCAASAAEACTLCHSSVAERVREQLLDATFVANALAVCAPLPVFLALILLAARRRGPQ